MTEPALRSARPEDVPEINALRLVVRENRLSDPSWLTDELTMRAISEDGCGWVWEEGGRILGFCITRDVDASIWALFVDPEAEGRGIGRSLLAPATERLRALGHQVAQLTTDPGTRAERFYLAQGWHLVGPAERGEVRLAISLTGEPDDMASFAP
jgi:GNAT superfamily N-acetyltransferase